MLPLEAYHGLALGELGFLGSQLLPVIIQRLARTPQMCIMLLHRGLQ